MKKIKLETVRKILVVVLVAVVFGGGGFWLGGRQEELERIRSVGSALELVTSREVRREVDFSTFWDVWGRLEKSYLETDDIDATKMVNGAIAGMTQALGDPYTAYLPPAANKQSREDLNGEFAGVGIQLGYINSTLAVMAPLPGQPAEKAGIKAGDLILHLKDDKKKLDVDTDGMSLPEAVQNIRGTKGESITLTMFHEGDGSSKEVTLVRDMIVVPSVEVKFVDASGKESPTGGYAHLIVSKFGERTMVEWQEAVNKILGNTNVKGIVLDLRNNPGGFLQRAIDLAGEFISGGVVVQQQGKFDTETFSVNRSGKLVGEKMVVLVNKGSASASEILAGALRERLGTKLVGENTFGKGTVQEAQELPNGAGLHVTVAKWLLPKGTNIHKVGLKPDIEVKAEVASGSAQAVDNQLIKAIEELGV